MPKLKNILKIWLNIYFSIVKVHFWLSKFVRKNSVFSIHLKLDKSAIIVISNLLFISLDSSLMFRYLADVTEGLTDTKGDVNW